MSFIDDYFLNPIAGNGWFNPVNTIVYALILVIAAYYVYRMLKKLDIKIDVYFAIAILPFIFWASTTRVLHDAAFAGALNHFLNNAYSIPYFVTPGSYFITFALALASLAIGLAVQKYLKFGKKIGYWRIMLFLGTIFSTINVCLLPIVTFTPMIYILPVVCLWTVIFLIAKHLLNRIKPELKIFSYANICLLAAHMFDAAATWTALSFFGYAEQHVLPRLLIGIMGPAAMFALKIIVVIPVLYIIDRYAQQEGHLSLSKNSKTKTMHADFTNFLKIVILILGLAPALRDMIRLMAMV
jgi:uncharacterized membrane protein